MKAGSQRIRLLVTNAVDVAKITRHLSLNVHVSMTSITQFALQARHPSPFLVSRRKLRMTRTPLPCRLLSKYGPAELFLWLSFLPFLYAG